MASPKYPGFDTLALHAGQHPDETHGARAVPIYQTTSYVFRSTEQAASIFNGERPGHVYSRITNPTNAVLEERVSCAGGRRRSAIATASGQAALHLALATLLPARAPTWSPHCALYGGSHNLLSPTPCPASASRPPSSIPRDPGRVPPRRSGPRHKGAVRRDPGQPRARRAGHPRRWPRSPTRRGCRCCMDSTFATPYLCRPFEHGADLLFHSATKFLAGHGVGDWRRAGGLGGKFDWDGLRDASNRAQRALRGVPRHELRPRSTGLRRVHHARAQGRAPATSAPA